MRAATGRWVGLLLGLGAVLGAGRAAAWPVDVRVELAPGEARVVRLSAVEWVEVDDPQRVAAEVLPGGQELLLEARGEGEAILLLYAQGRFAVWKLVVGASRSAEAQVEMETHYGAALGACPGLTAGGGDKAVSGSGAPAGSSERGADARTATGRTGSRRVTEPSGVAGPAAARRVALPPQGGPRALSGVVKGEACRAALHALLKTDAFLARELELTFDLETLQAQLGLMDAAWTRARLPVSGRYEGAGLVLAGEVTVEQHRRALREAFLHSVGKVSLEDRMVVAPPPPTDASVSTEVEGKPASGIPHEPRVPQRPGSESRRGRGATRER